MKNFALLTSRNVLKKKHINGENIAVQLDFLQPYHAHFVSHGVDNIITVIT